jgi:outer membrane lipoprotein-sorting protein
MFTRSRTAAIGLAPILAFLAGCVGPNNTPGDAPSDASMSVDAILSRCQSTYEKLNTLEARGWLRDYRGKEKRVEPISWELAKPDLCRLQIGMEMVLVKGQNWWSYDSRAGRFKSHREPGPAPIETAAYFLSQGIPFLMPSAWHRPVVVFGPNTARGPWQLENVAWTGGRPCYVITREGLGRDSGSRWRLWIDQDRFLLVAWTWAVDQAGPDGSKREATIWGCTYEELIPGQAINPDRFRIERPSPIVLPHATPSEPENTREPEL